MKSIKKILAVVLAVLLMATSMAACGRRVDNTSPDSDKEATASPSAEPSKEPEGVNAETAGESAQPADETAEPTPEATETDVKTTLPNETRADADEVLGSFDGSTYTNRYFGFSLDLPEGWYISSREELAKLMQITADYLKSNTDTTIDLTKQQLVPLFFTAQSNPAEGAAANPNIVCLAQNIGLASSMITDVKSFLNATIQQVAAQGMNMSFGEPETLDINGHEVGRVSGTTKQNGVEFKQTMYVFIIEDYVIDFTLSSFTDDEAAALEDVMSTLSFK